MLKAMTGVYKITHLPTGYVYIGSSTDIGRRFKQHKRDLVDGKSINSFLQVFFYYDGMRSLKFEVIQEFKEATRDELLEYERYYISQYPLCMNVVTDTLVNKYTHGRSIQP